MKQSALKQVFDWRSRWPLTGAALVCAFGLFAARPLAAAPLTTRWGSSVSATNLDTEYPRPQFVRDRWQSLNGLWNYTLTRSQVLPPTTFLGSILVPFPLESSLSGASRKLDAASVLWYRRDFSVPAEWRGQSILLHFGAVNSVAEVFVNGVKVGVHRGGYDAFSFDITSRLHWGSTNNLAVAVTHAPEGDYPFGKQFREPRTVFYTSSSGIWQTVWLEPVPPTHLTDLRLTPDLSGSSVRVLPLANALDPECQVDVRAYVDGEEVGAAAGPPGGELNLALRTCRPWTPESPFLYDLTVKLRRGSNELDLVRSYFGLRQIRTGTNGNGGRALILNGQPVFQLGVLDQGYWPDGLYSPPADAAMRADLETARRLGFNMVRKHQKIEPDRWYYWADKLGLLVWQDMPQAINDTAENRLEFESELHHMVRGLGNHPSIVAWVLFNETWGRYDLERLTLATKRADPNRLVVAASGGSDQNFGDVLSIHCFGEDCALPPETGRPVVFGILGGASFLVPGHLWFERTFSDYHMAMRPEELTQYYSTQMQGIWRQHAQSALAGCVYVQLYDIESECNGLLTYDREVQKIPTEIIRQANQPFIQALERLGAGSSQVNPPDPVISCLMRADPKSSNDHTVPRFTWWPHRGGTEWIWRETNPDQTISSVELYWFDDTTEGHCRVPASWRLLYRDGDVWKPVTNPSSYGIERDGYNHVTFDPVRTSALKLEAQLKPDYSSGILQWRINEP